MNLNDLQEPITIWPDFYNTRLEPKPCDWYDPTKAPFKMAGLAFFEKDGEYFRYPKNPPEPLPKGVIDNALGSSGAQIRFSAETSRVCIRLKLNNPASPHPTANTSALLAGGVDLYASYGDGKYVMCGISNFDATVPAYEATLLDMSQPKKLDFIINLPVRNKIQNVYIGLAPGAKLIEPPAFKTDKRIVIYGGSIMQGYCASRPGMTMPNILARRLNQEVINLGVSGSGKCERETALSVALVERPSILIMSPEGNCPTPEFITEHMTEFIETYRQSHPTVPIAVMGYMKTSKEEIDEKARESRLRKKAAMMAIVEDFRSRGDQNIYYWNGEEFTEGENDIVFEGHSAGLECTADTDHKSDLGFFLMANGMIRKLRELGLS